MNENKQIMIHLGIGVFTFILLFGTLFIPQSVDFPERKVSLGFPIHFYSLDFGTPYTTMGGVSDSSLKSHKFNIMSSWEEHTSWSWSNLVISYLILFFMIEIVIYVTL